MNKCCSNCKFEPMPISSEPCRHCMLFSRWFYTKKPVDVKEITYTVKEVMELLGYSQQCLDENCELYDIPVWVFGNGEHKEMNCTIIIPQDIQDAISNVINYYKNLGKKEILDKLKELLD